MALTFLICHQFFVVLFLLQLEFGLFAEKLQCTFGQVLHSRSNY